jgi:lipopolysaccharide/colanic/teichoic acid biosynthesis glycosyltransferase
MENKNTHKPYGPYEKYFKRPLDICCGLAALIVFWWLYLIIAILVRVKLGSPVLFTQDRPGKDEKIFKLYKFRTMTDERDENGELLPDEMRLTKFGKLLRSTSLDELPEVFNIICGELSVVGPRPLAVQYLPYYNDIEKHRHDVRPGLSGLAQVNGRNGLQWEERFTCDIKYVEKITFFGDISIILMTIKKAFSREGVVVRGTGKTMDFDKYRKQQLEEVRK